MVDADVEIRQQRAIGVARLQPWQAQQRAALQHQIADIQPRAEPVERPPVQCHLGHLEERPAGVLNLHILKHRGAKDRAADPPDLHPHSGVGFIVANGINQQAMANSTVKRQQPQRQQHHHPERQTEQIFQPDTRGRAARWRGFWRCGFRNITGHQNA